MDSEYTNAADMDLIVDKRPRVALLRRHGTTVFHSFIVILRTVLYVRMYPKGTTTVLMCVREKIHVGYALDRSHTYFIQYVIRMLTLRTNVSDDERSQTGNPFSKDISRSEPSRSGPLCYCYAFP